MVAWFIHSFIHSSNIEWLLYISTILRIISMSINQRGFLTRGVHSLVMLNTQLSICHKVELLIWFKRLWGALEYKGVASSPWSIGKEKLHKCSPNEKIMIQLIFLRQQTCKGKVGGHMERAIWTEGIIQEKPRSMSQQKWFRVWQVVLWLKCEVRRWNIVRNE